MSTPYVGEVRMFGFPRIPTGWFACDGSLKSIAEYQTLYTLIGTTYGGNGVQTFGVPDLRGRAPLHQGRGPGLTQRVMGEVGGTEQVTLNIQQIPQHNHNLLASNAAATTVTPGPTVALATIASENLYIPSVTGLTPMALAPQSVGMTGNTLAHDNMMPTLTVSYCIAWAGIFPSQQ